MEDAPRLVAPFKDLERQLIDAFLAQQGNRASGDPDARAAAVRQASEKICEVECRDLFFRRLSGNAPS